LITLYITASGNVLINNGVSDIALNLKDLKSWDQFLEMALSDPIQRLLIQKGPFFIKDIAEEVESDLIKRIEKTNFVFSISLLSLKTSALRLYVTVRLLQYYIGLNKLKIKDPKLKKLISKDKDFFINLYKKQKNSSKKNREELENEKIKDPITGDVESIL